MPIVERLLAAGSVVRIHDPVVNMLPERWPKRVSSSRRDLEDAVAGADAAVLVTRWRQYEALPELLARLDPQPLLVDGRRIVDPDSVARYEGIGRPATTATEPRGPSRVP